MATFLYNRDSKGKIRVMVITVTRKKDAEVYLINKQSGLLSGKLTQAPEIIIDEGKAKRTVKEQCELKFKSLVKSQRDKGYLLASDFIGEELLATLDPMDYATIDKYYPSEKTDASGNRMPMKAKDAKDKKDRKFFDRAFWVSKKLDGVRTLAHLEDGELVFKSKSGKPYKGVTTNFKNDPELIALVMETGGELDGEFYVHGMPLKDINGHCQKQEYIPERHDQIEFWLFDIAIDGLDATQRIKLLQGRKFRNSKVKVLEHHYCIGKEEIDTLVDLWVKEGFEGGMGRTTIGKYEWGKKSDEIWKFKPFMDDEFEIIGKTEGARKEDFCFLMKTKDGVEFKAKPDGTREERELYYDMIDQLIGRFGTVKFQYYTPDGSPFLPKFKCLRDLDE